MVEVCTREGGVWVEVCTREGGVSVEVCTRVEVCVYQGRRSVGRGVGGVWIEVCTHAPSIVCRH